MPFSNVLVYCPMLCTAGVAQTHTGTIVTERWMCVITVAINLCSFSNYTANLVINFAVLQHMYHCQFD
jgi:hypothetical protein